MKYNLTKEVSFTALFMAIIFVLTFVVQIPIPLGYANLSSLGIFIACLILDWKFAIVAGSCGAMLADLLLGFPYWCLPTLVIKAVMVLIFYPFAKKKNFKPGLFTLLGAILSWIWAIVGYAAAGMVISGSVQAGLVSAIGLMSEAVINIAAFMALWVIFEKSHFVEKARNFMRK